MPELDSITVPGFKSIASIENLKLGAINVVIGPNGSGKSNLLGAFALFNALRMGHLKRFVATEGGADRLLHFGAKHTRSIRFEFVFQDGHKYGTPLIHSAGDTLEQMSEIRTHTRKALKELGWRVFHFHDTGPASPVKLTADLNDNAYLRADGSNLAACPYFNHWVEQLELAGT